MGARGPAPTPLKLLEARGSRHPRTVRKRMAGGVNCAVAAPSAPKDMDAEVTLVWRHAVRHLVALGIVHHLDRSVLEIHCRSVVRARKIERELAVSPLCTETKKGSLVANPLVFMLRAVQDMAVRTAVQLGMTPSARARVRPMEQKPTAADPKDRFSGAAAAFGPTAKGAM